MVRALLDGSKTQTRRIFKPERMTFDADGRYSTHAMRGGELACTGSGPFIPSNWLHYCPYGQPGDQLWVREAWAQPTNLDPGPTFYRADYPACVPSHFENVPPAEIIKWKPSIHMPRWASRITLEITGVRVERLQDISEVDAKAEGCAPAWLDAYDHTTVHAHAQPTYKRGYARLWGEINGDASWDANPWVWIVEFRVITP